MLLNVQSFLSLTLAVSTLFSSNAVARPHSHSQAHSGLHLPRYAKRFSRASPEKRDALSTFQSEVKSFEDFMNSFVQSNSTSQDALSQLQGKVAGHIQAVQDYASSVGNSSSATGGSVPQLQTDAQAFQSWINNWVQDITYMSSSSALSELGSELQSYEGWLNAWLGIGGSSSGTVPASQPTSLPLPASTGATTLLMRTVSQTSTDTIVSTQVVTGQSPAPTISSAAATSPSDVPQPSSSPSAVSSPSASPSSVSAVISSASSAAASSPTAVSSTPASPSPSGAPGGGSSSPKLAAWWGQTSAASTYGLSAICSDDSYDIVMLSFLNDFFSAGGLPTLNLGPSTGAPSAAQSAAGATGLFNGDDLSSAIQSCQSSGKKVMLTLGGAAGYSSSAFESDSQAQDFAETIWNLFLGGQSALRPFGNLKLDGIDVDNENKDQTGYSAFVSALRGKFSSDSSKQYYVSGAPQCPQPDASIPMDAMTQMDWVWVQFYNNPSCNHGSSGFAESVQSWSKSLAGSKAQLFIGAIADSSQGSGFISGGDLASEVKQVQGMGLSNFGGYALWDASLAIQQGGMQSTIKQALS